MGKILIVCTVSVLPSQETRQPSLRDFIAPGFRRITAPIPPRSQRFLSLLEMNLIPPGLIFGFGSNISEVAHPVSNATAYYCFGRNVPLGLVLKR